MFLSCLFSTFQLLMSRYFLYLPFINIKTTLSTKLSMCKYLSSNLYERAYVKDMIMLFMIKSFSFPFSSVSFFVY